MLKKLGKKITNNFGLKLLATLFAVVLWIVVINIDNPTTVQPFTTSITTENTDYLTEQNKYFEALDGKNTITFYASAERSVLSEMANSDFSAVADMEKIEYNENTGTYRVPVTITPKRYTNKVTITSKQLYLEVVLGDLGTCQKVIVPNTKGTVADGCALGNLEIVGSNLLKISGPAFIISQIDSAVATINIDGVSTDVTDSVVPVLYDADGNAIDTTRLTLSLDTVTVSAQILSTKDVSLEFNTTGKVAEGYMITGIEYPLETVRIKGESAILNPVNKIIIPAEVLDVTDITEDFVTTVDISSYLPSGTSLVLTSDAKIEVTVKVEPIMSKTFEVPVANLTVENLREAYLLEFDEDVVVVEISGPESVISELKAKNIEGTVNANGLGVGKHRLTVNFALEEYCWLTETVKVPAAISGNGNTNSNDDAGQDAETSVSTETTETSSGNATSVENATSTENTTSAENASETTVTHE